MNLGCLNILTFGLLGRAASKSAPVKEPLPYGLRDEFLSAAELSFFHVLRSTLGTDATIVIKPRLGDVLFVRQPHKNQAARNQINMKHVDFMLCETPTMKPRLVIELDDSSHQRSKRQERDAFVDEALATAGLPILHVTAARTYAPKELYAMIQEAMTKPKAKPGE